MTQEQFLEHQNKLQDFRDQIRYLENYIDFVKREKKEYLSEFAKKFVKNALKLIW